MTIKVLPISARKPNIIYFDLHTHWASSKHQYAIGNIQKPHSWMAYAQII